MGKSEILMLLAGVILSIALALVVVPSFTKGGSLAKTSLVNSDISSIRKVGSTYVQSQSTSGDFNGINAEKISFLIPALKLVGVGAASKLISTADAKISYQIGTNVEKDKLIITVIGLENIEGSEESVIKTQSTLITNDLSTDVKDGKVILHFKG